MLGKIEGRMRRGWQDEMVGWHHRLNGHESEQVLGVGDGRGSLACCSPWDHRVGHDRATELNWYTLRVREWVSLFIQNVTEPLDSPQKVCLKQIHELEHVRTLYGTTYWFKIEKYVWQCCLLSPCLFNLYAEDCMRHARLESRQAGKTSKTSDMWMIPF